MTSKQSLRERLAEAEASPEEYDPHYIPSLRAALAQEEEAKKAILFDLLKLIESAYPSSISSYAKLEMFTHGGGRIIGHQMGEDTELDSWETPEDFAKVVVELRKRAKKNKPEWIPFGETPVNL